MTNINDRTLKTEIENARALTLGLEINGKTIRTSILVATKNSKFLQSNFENNPKLITFNKEHTKKLSEYGRKIGKNPIPYKYIAKLSAIYHIENKKEIWDELCNSDSGVFFIWEPEAPYENLGQEHDAEEKDYRIVLLRVYEIYEEFSEGDIDHSWVRADKIKSDREVTIKQPVIIDADFYDIEQKIENVLKKHNAFRYVNGSYKDDYGDEKLSLKVNNSHVSPSQPNFSVISRGNPISPIHNYITNQGLTFEKKIIANYYTSLKTKPFVILTGLSGTGKTKLAEYFARFMCHEKGQVNEDRYAFIPVRPDWMDNRGLLGFHNLISETFQPSPLLKLMLRACGDNTKPYFVILDEMNIAKVEYYFSDFLSCLETRKTDENGEIVQEPIILHNRERCVAIENLDGLENKINLCPHEDCVNFEKCRYGYQVKTNGKTVIFVPPKLKIPLNVYFTGTVNVDETTYMFSPKVLDRANTIEFDEIDLNGYFNQKIGNTTDIFDQDYSDFTNKGEFCTSPNVNEIKKNFPEFEQYTNKLKELNEKLQPHQMHFGYRVVNEILLYLKNAKNSGTDLEVSEAFDYQIKQKILPKFHGSRNKLEEPLKEIQQFCIKNDCSESEKKIKRMLDILKSQGFVSFA